ncbi:MAG: CPBP family intramembrane metalloprotease [Coriobacteriia bacterium]|nr:CPBP family intramembrane metalloprotease [Coriobacteriia bacterium]
MSDTSDGQPVRSYLDWAERGAPGFWRYMTGLVIIFVVAMLISQLVGLLYVVLFPAFMQTPVGSLLVIPFGTLLTFIAVPLVAWLLNKRPWWSVAMPTLRFDGFGFFTGLLAMMAVLVGANIVTVVTEPGAITYAGFDPRIFAASFVVAFLGLFVQTASEEMTYRGYLTQFARRFSASPILFLGIPALVFALPHYGNISANGFISIVPYLIDGLLFGWLAYRSGSLWMAVGAHLGNNFFVTMIVGNPGDVVPTGAPFLLAAGASSSDLNNVVSSLVVAGVVVALAEIAIRKRASGSQIKSASA